MIQTEGSVAGVDEVGRGCLFGPVFAGAVVLSKSGENNLLFAGLKDSKVLTAKKRAELIPIIKETATAWGLGQASPREIDLLGIRTATERAMLRALQRISSSESIQMILVDGILPLRLWDGPQKTVVKGETHFPSIAAASVLAKESRDGLIKRLAIKFPNYGLERHVGYGTKFHRNALLSKGPTILHRQSFLSNILKP